jgi:adenylate kinase
VRVVMIGPPGAGKGTQARLLEERLGIPQISTGDILRAARRNGTRLGAEVRRFMDEGKLVPDEIVIGIVEERLGVGDCGRGFVLDGFPRTVGQAHALDGLLARRGEPIDRVLQITVPRAEVVRRLSGRRVCSACGTMFHLRFEPPTRPDVCDRCGGALVQREDDREDTILRRLDVYERDTAPVLAHYRAAGLVREAAGTGTVDEVFERVAASLQ